MNPMTLEAVYEDGVLRPLEQLDLPQHKRVLVTICDVVETPPQAAVTCYDLAQRAGMIGALKASPEDLSTNPQHFEGFGT